MALTMDDRAQLLGLADFFLDEGFDPPGLRDN
jgi:hypothetical protein